MCESTGLRIVHNQFAAFNQLYRNFLLRVTPNLARVDSSNLNPQEFWNYGFNLGTIFAGLKACANQL